MAKPDRRYPPIYPWLRTLLVGILHFLMRLLARFHVEGVKNVPMEGPLIVVANHLHHFDSPAIGCTIPRLTWALAAEKYEYHIFGPLLTLASGAIYIQRGEVDRDALRQALNVLEDGHCLAVAPEGTRSKTGGLQRPKSGAAYLANRSGAVLMPVVVWGTADVIPAWFRLRRADVYVRYGRPFRLPPERARAAQLDDYTDRIMVELARLLPEQYRGVYADHPLLKEPAPSPS